MKHKNSHLLVGYWSRLRAGRDVPDQTDIDPRAIKRLLSYTFILDCENPARPIYRLAVAVLAIGGFASAALAQTGRNYDVKTMNFDLWCQETAHLPVDRCDKRTDADEKTFEAYRAQIERYEVPYLQQQRDDLTLSRDILHNDPVDNPIRQDPQAQQHDPNEQPKTPAP